jgi:hypothetical protein
VSDTDADAGDLAGLSHARLADFLPLFGCDDIPLSLSLPLLSGLSGTLKRTSRPFDGIIYLLFFLYTVFQTYFITHSKQVLHQGYPTLAPSTRASSRQLEDIFEDGASIDRPLVIERPDSFVPKKGRLKKENGTASKRT